MNTTHIIWPVLVQVFLTMSVYILLAMKKAKAIKLGQVDRQQTALNNKAWPTDVVKASNNIANQFEVPVLFYVICLVILNMNMVGIVEVALAWIFVLSRVAHAYVHIGSNYVPMRLKLFLVGCLSLIAMLMMTVWRLMTSG